MGQAALWRRQETIWLACAWSAVTITSVLPSAARAKASALYRFIQIDGFRQSARTGWRRDPILSDRRALYLQEKPFGLSLSTARSLFRSSPPAVAWRQCAQVVSRVCRFVEVIGSWLSADQRTGAYYRRRTTPAAVLLVARVWPAVRRRCSPTDNPAPPPWSFSDFPCHSPLFCQLVERFRAAAQRDVGAGFQRLFSVIDHGRAIFQRVNAHFSLVSSGPCAREMTCETSAAGVASCNSAVETLPVCLAGRLVISAKIG